MIQALCQAQFDEFQSGRLANGFTQDIWKDIGNSIGRTCNMPPFAWDKCKNKYTDLKKKYDTWVILSNTPAVSWNEAQQRFTAPEAVWRTLNRLYPGAIWHKVHSLPHRKMLAPVMDAPNMRRLPRASNELPPDHLLAAAAAEPASRRPATATDNVPASGGGEVSGVNGRAATVISSEDRRPLLPLLPLLQSPNKRARVEVERPAGPAEDRRDDEPSLEANSESVRVDNGRDRLLRMVTEELARTREREERLDASTAATAAAAAAAAAAATAAGQQEGAGVPGFRKDWCQEAQTVFRREFKGRLDTVVFVRGLTLFEIPAKAQTFVGLRDAEERDAWVEISLQATPSR